MYLRLNILLILLLTGAGGLLAQSRKVTGMVTSDKKQPVPGATITEENNEKNNKINENKKALRGENSFNQNDPHDAEIAIPDSVYRIGHSDLFACKSCKVKGDKWFMLTHPEYCKG